jgi:acetolactate synthase-1/2/3 large subunit
VHAGAAAEARRLAESQDLPTVQTLMALGCLEAEHPLNLGMLGMHAAPFTNHALEACDLLLAVGARFDDRATGKLEAFCPGAKVVHIDIDARELGKLRRPQVALKADAKAALIALLRCLSPRARPAWRTEVAALREAHPLPEAGLDGARQPFGLLRACARLLPEATVATDVGQHQMWAAQAFPQRRPRRWLTSGGLGTMGFGLPAAIGAALSDATRPVLCISGDGSLLMNLQEFVTAAELQADVKVLLMDNQALGLVTQQQDLFYGERRSASIFQHAPDWMGLAAAFGWTGFDLGQAADVETMLAEALLTPGPVLVRAPIKVGHQVLPMVPPGKANIEMLGAKA